MRGSKKIRTFVDANILIRATNIEDASLIAEIAAMLDDEGREFIASDFLELEVLPKPTRNKFQISIDFCRDFFALCVERVVTDERLMNAAFAEACRLGLSAPDAIHLVAANFARADEFVTLEKPTKPMYKSKLVRVVYLHSI